VFKSFGTIIALSRELNISIAVPELVLVSSGSDAQADLLLNALLGTNVVPAVLSSASRSRSLAVSVLHNAALGDGALKLGLKQAGANDVAPLKNAEQAYAELEKALAAKGTGTVTLLLESSRVWSISILVPPLLAAAAADDAASNSNNATVLALCQDTRRILLGVEKAKDWDASSLAAFVRQADAKGDRTVLLYTAFSEFVQTCAGTKELNAWLFKSGAASIDSKVHFATLGAAEKLDALHKSEMELLEQMQYDLHFERAVGAEGTRRQVLDLLFRKYQEFVPAVLKTLRSYKADALQNHQSTKAQIAALESYRLRAVANQHVMSFLQTIEKLCKGTLEGSPTHNGQTSAEERAEAGVLWRDAAHAVRAVDDAKWKINGADAKLYGGQQFERLLSEFRALVLNTPMPDLNAADIAVAAGPQRLGGAPSNVAWAASELVRRAVTHAFAPLIDQLLERAVFVLERQLAIAERILDQKAKQPVSTSGGPGAIGASSGLGLSDLSSGASAFGASLFGASDPVAASPAPDAAAATNVKDFPYFTAAVKSFYLDVVYALADRARAKCLDEFRCTQMIMWNAGGIDDSKLPSKKRDDPKELKKNVSALSQDLFDAIKKRLADNVVLKCHNSLLVPISEFLYTEIQGKISRLTDADIEAMFEVGHNREKLGREEKQLEAVAKRFEKLEGDFMSAADQFTRTRQFQ
jgi:hypothetical protein